MKGNERTDFSGQIYDLLFSLIGSYTILYMNIFNFIFLVCTGMCFGAVVLGGVTRLTESGTLYRLAENPRECWNIE